MLFRSLVSFVEEIREYLPIMRHGVEAFYCDASQKPALHESYRLAHSTKGTASMVGLPALAHVSYYAETLFEALHEGTASLNDNGLQGALGLLNCIERFLDGVVSESFDERAVLVEAIVLNRRVLGLPETDDEQAISAVLNEVSPTIEVASDSELSPRPGTPGRGVGGEGPDAEDASDSDAAKPSEISDFKSQISDFRSQISDPISDVSSLTSSEISNLKSEICDLGDRKSVV